MSDKENYQQKYSKCRQREEKLKAENAALKSRLEEAERERDTAVAVVKEYRDCQDCAHYLTDVCKQCKRVKDEDGFLTRPYWQWRGAQVDGGGE